MMRLPPFEYRAPRTVAEALTMKSAPGAAYVAGGTDLYPNMKRRHQTPTTLVDLMPLTELRGVVEQTDGGLAIGACELLDTLARTPRLQADYPALVQAVLAISTPLLRNMGTLGGNMLLDTRCNYYDQSYEWRKAIDFCMKKDGAICWVAPGSPRCWAVQSSDTVPVLVAMDAAVVLHGPHGERTVPAAELYRDDGIDYLTKAADELLTTVLLPPRGDSRMAFRKLRRRGAFDFPVLNVAVWLRGQPVVEQARIVVSAVGSCPRRAVEAEALVTGQRLTPELCEAAAEAAYRPAKPLDNTDFAYAWRKQMVRKFVREALLQLSA